MLALYIRVGIPQHHEVLFQMMHHNIRIFNCLLIIFSLIDFDRDLFSIFGRFFTHKAFRT